MKHGSVGALLMQPGGVVLGLFCWRRTKGDQVAGTLDHGSFGEQGHRRAERGNPNSPFSDLCRLERTGNNQVVGDRAFLVRSMPCVLNLQWTQAVSW